MGGALGVESAAGAGSQFWVELPGVEAPVERYARVARDAQLNEPTRRPSCTVLQIEDNPANLQLVEHILAQRPAAQLISASQGRLGVELARQHRPDLVLLDLHLPDIGGDQVLRELRADPITADIPVIILSADATGGQIRRLRDDGAADYLTKPLDVRRLLELVDRLPAQATTA